MYIVQKLDKTPLLWQIRIITIIVIIVIYAG